MTRPTRGQSISPLFPQLSCYFILCCKLASIILINDSRADRRQNVPEIRPCLADWRGKRGMGRNKRPKVCWLVAGHVYDCGDQLSYAVMPSLPFSLFLTVGSYLPDHNDYHARCHLCSEKPCAPHNLLLATTTTQQHKSTS